MTVSMGSFFSPGNMGKGGNASLFNRPAGSGSTTGGGYQSIASSAFDATSGMKTPKIDPYTGSTRKGEIAMGAAAGATVGGPLGAVIGGMIGATGIAGGLLGSASSNDKRIAKRTATQQSYAAGQAAYDYVSAGSAAADEVYNQGLTSGRAKLAGQGIEVDGSPQWADLKAGLAKTRTETRAGLDQEMASFRSSGALEWVENDYDYMLRTTIANPRGRHKGESSKFKIGPEPKGRSNEQLFTDAQYGQLRAGGERKRMDRYASMLAPGADVYMKGKFGTAAEKATFQSSMDSRIATANKWYDREVAQDKIFEAQQQARNDRSDQRK